MNRREFTKSSLLALFPFPNLNLETKKTHIVTLSFDDGFRKSSIKIAQIFEKYQLKACFNVIASGHLPSFVAPDKWMAAATLGDFVLWNELKAQGHEIMPHSWQHPNYTQISSQAMRDDVDKCLEYFELNLKGFKSSKAVYNLPYNASNPEIETYLLSKVKAIRTKIVGTDSLNPLPNKNTRIISCESHGEEIIDDWLEAKINTFLRSNGGWLVINTHGLDNEGWGPISSKMLEKTLDRLRILDNVAILPTSEVLKMK